MVDLEDLLKPGDVLQTEESEAPQRRVLGKTGSREVATQLREEDLSAVCGRGDPVRLVDAYADVVVADDLCFSGMDTHTDANLRRRRPRMAAQLQLPLDRGRKRVGNPLERYEERVTFRADLDSMVHRGRVPDESPVLLEEIRVRLAEERGEPRRAFDIGKEKRDGARRQRSRHVRPSGPRLPGLQATGRAPSLPA